MLPNSAVDAAQIAFLKFSAATVHSEKVSPVALPSGGLNKHYKLCSLLLYPHLMKKTNEISVMFPVYV